MSDRCCAKCSNPFVACANRDCRCHPATQAQKDAALQALREQQANLRAETRGTAWTH